jgi:acetolactate synthase-1/2/3 large subunit
MFVNEAIAAAVASADVDMMFGLIGDSNLFMVNAFVEQFGGRYVSAVHEASAVMMAHGYASRAGRLGVATVTQGPGLTNTATALVEAVRASTPLLLLTGDTAPSNLHNLQTLEQEPFVRSTGADYIVVENPPDAADAVRRAVGVALGHSRPVVLNCPTEFMWAEVNYRNAPVPSAHRAPTPLRDDELDLAVGVIASAQRPIVVAGRGVVASGAREAVLAFARRVGAPIMTTLRARNLYGAIDGSLGVIGTLSSEKGSQAIADCDCVIVFGASLNTWTTVHNTLLGDKTVVHVDTDAGQIGRNTKVAAPVCGDAAAVAEAITSWLDEAEIPPTPFRDRVTDGLRPDELNAAPPARGRLSFASALTDIMAALPPHRTVVFDGGRFLGEAFAHVRVPDVARQVLSTSFGAVGLGMGAAIGAACAAPDEPTVLVTGDGGFMMNGLAELQSAVRQGIHLTVLICNDGSYGAEYDQYINKGVKPDLSLFDWPSFASVAMALGAEGVTVDSLEGIATAVDAVRSGERCLVVDVRVAAADVPEVPH